MEIALAGAAFPGKYQRRLAASAEPRRQPDPIGNAQLRTQMRDHPANKMLAAAEMEASLAAFAVTVGTTLPLLEQPGQRHPPAGEDTQIAMQRQDPFFRFHRQCSSNRNSLLANPAKPFADLP